MKSVCASNMIRRTILKRYLYDFRDVTTLNRGNILSKAAGKPSLPETSKLLLNNIGRHQRLSVASTYFTNNEISSTATKSEPTAENGNDIINEDVILEQQDHIPDSIETLTNEEKIERIIVSSSRFLQNGKLTTRSAVQIIFALKQQIPIDVLRPIFLEASKIHNNLAKKNNLESTLNIGTILGSEDSKGVPNIKDRLNPNDVVNSLVNILNTLGDENVKSIDSPVLTQILYFLTKHLELDEENCFALRSVENSLTWKSRNMSMKDLSYLLSYSVKRKNDNHGYKVTITLLNEIIKNIERRWVEVESANEFVSILHYYPQHFSEHFISKIEERITEFVENMDAEELVLVLKMVGSKKRRNAPLLRALTYHLLKRRSDLNMKMISDCLFAFNQLSFKNVELLEGLCDAAQQILSSNNVYFDKLNERQQLTITRSILTSLGLLKFRHKELLNSICALMSEKLDKNEWPGSEGASMLIPKDQTAFLMTTATLNYVPVNSEKLYQAVIQELTAKYAEDDTTSDGDAMWLNMVWCMTILNKAPHSCLASVLSNDFYNRLLYSHSQRNVHVILKLLNINAAAKLDPNYKGPTIDATEDPLLKDVRSAPSKDKSSFVAKAMEDFSKFASPPKYLVPDINTLMGFQVEGEAAFDRNGKAIPIEGLSIFADTTPTGNSARQLPEGARRMAVLCVGYHDCLADGTTLNGATALNLKLLEAKLKVFVIMHNYSQPRQNTIDRVQMLDAKLKTFLSPLIVTE